MKTRYVFFENKIEEMLNVTLIREYQFDARTQFEPVGFIPRKWRFDYAIPAEKIAIEIEGGVWRHKGHTGGAGYLKDIEKYNRATLLGWAVFRIAAHKTDSHISGFIKMLEQYRCSDETQK